MFTVFAPAPWPAVIVTLVSAETVLVVTWNEALVWFAGTVIVAGTEATPILLLLRGTMKPLNGAGPFSLTEASANVPAVTI